jgi:FKBP-type peptidyl-prolyl cis-trans isomerase
MRFSILITYLFLSVFSQAQTWLKTDDATAFRFIYKNEKGTKVIPNMILLADLFGTAKKASNPLEDTVIFNSISNDKPFYIPTEQPGLQNVFYKLNAGDSIEIRVLADTFYNKTFNTPLPDYVAKGSVVSLFFHIQEALTQNEIEQKAKEQNTPLVNIDSLRVKKYCNGLKGIKKLPSGLRYKILKSNPKGIQTKNGSLVSVKYKGWLIEGDVFDENLKGEPFKFVLGMKQVIQGWEQGLRLMKTGETLRLIIPWYLAYGTKGNGPIPPFTSIIFDVQLIDIK